MPTEPQTPGTNTNDTGAPATPDSLLTADPAAPAEPGATDPATPPADGATPAAPTEPAGAPEEYADFTVPEGMTLDTEAIGELKVLAKEKNLGQEDTQKFVDLGAKIVQKVESQYKDQIANVQAGWLEATKTDKEFGGDNLQENVAVAKKALDAFGTPELSKLLTESGLGNNPEIIRVLYRVGKAVSEDRLVPGDKKPGGAGKTAADTFYDKK